jgi:hypothetical protein
LDHLPKSWCDPQDSRSQGFEDSSEIHPILNEFEIKFERIQ